jgi:hypothetical protein
MKKMALVLTDGAEPTVKMAEKIAAALKGYKVTVKAASGFDGTDLLPAGVFFIGCEKPVPASFGYLTEMLRHINLAGRSCGVFTPGTEKTAKYLADLVKASGAALNPNPLLASDTKTLETWIEKVLVKNF